jgi:hypothetical protein
MINPAAKKVGAIDNFTVQTADVFGNVIEQAFIASTKVSGTKLASALFDQLWS